MKAPVDLNPDPHILEVNIETRVQGVTIVPGTSTPIWGYDGVSPGPLLHLHVGDRLIVHVTNSLPEETTIHWHGLRIPVAMDGVPDNPTPAIKPGGTFTYDFVVPDAGLYWYHPHVHSAAQEGDGLYGAILVDADDEPKDLGDEVVLVLSDIDVSPDGKLGDPTSGGDTATLFGREGTVILVNGKVAPRLGARVGVRQRWRVVNAAKSRYFQLKADGQSFVQIGTDGGRMSAPVTVEQPVMAPGERADFIWEPTGDPGTDIPLRWIPYDRGYGTAYMRPEVVMMTLALDAAPAIVPPPLPALTYDGVKPLDLTGATPVNIRLTRNDVDGKFALGINGLPFDGMEHVMAKVGETQIWTVSNEIDFAHPFHIHGFFFQVLDDSGAVRQPLAWKDTADVGVKKTIKLVVRYDDRPGMWMFHCHILDHADAGMMGMIMLER